MASLVPLSRLVFDKTFGLGRARLWFIPTLYICLLKMAGVWQPRVKAKIWQIFGEQK
jgi:hypothetical protein